MIHRIITLGIIPMIHRIINIVILTMIQRIIDLGIIMNDSQNYNSWNYNK